MTSLLRALPAVLALMAPYRADGQEAATITGNVRDAVSGQVIANRRVELATCASLVAVTDQAGAFAFTGPLVGTCQIEVPAGDGYLAGATSVLRVASGGKVHANISLLPSAAIGGRVVDPDGDPVQGAKVSIDRSSYSSGWSRNAGHVDRITDSSGRYFAEGLSAGRRTVYVLPRQLAFVQRKPINLNSPEDTEPVLSLAPTFYYRSLSTEQPTVVPLLPGQSRLDVDVRILRAPGVCISTELAVPPTWNSSEWIGVVLLLSSPAAQAPIASGRFRAAQTVEVCGVTPGSYKVMAASKDHNGHWLFANQDVSVSGSAAVRLPRLVLERTISIQGVVRLDDEDRSSGEFRVVAAPKIGIHLLPRHRAIWGGEELSGSSSAPGEFIIPSVMRDDYWVVVTGVPDGMYVKRVELMGRDVYLSGMRAGSGVLEVRVARNAATVHGVVLSRRGEPAPGSTVILVRAGTGVECGPNHLLHSGSDSAGQFEFRGLSPGDYEVAAFNAVPQDALGGTATAGVVRQLGRRVRVEAAQRVFVSSEVMVFPNGQ